MVVLGSVLAATAACDSSNELFPPNGSLRLVLQDSGLTFQTSSQPGIQVMQWTVDSATAELSQGTFEFLTRSPCDHFFTLNPFLNTSSCLNSGFSFGTDVAEPVGVQLSLGAMEVRRARFPEFETDPDIDDDGIPNDGDASGVVGDTPCESGQVVDCDDNCPIVPNADQNDDNGDGFGDACSLGDPPTVPNRDGDTQADALDNCVWHASDDFTDANGDGIGDVCEQKAKVVLDAPPPLMLGPVDVTIEDGTITLLTVDFDNRVTLSCDWVCNGLSCSDCTLQTDAVTLTAR